jgi:5'-methylthioadenosine phosphorylase
VHLAFLARHGTGHTHSPSSVPARANIAALKSLGVKAIVAFSAVGSLREEIRPGDFVLPDQIIDRTKGIRPASFFDETVGVVAHASFGDPFSRRLTEWLVPRVKKALEGRSVGLHEGKTVVCMEGPQFSTRAESQMYRIWGGDIINMSVLPEAKLAREAELRCVLCAWSDARGANDSSSCTSYALIATATDYDAWRVGEETVTAAEVFKTLKTNADTSRHVTAQILEELHAVVETGDILSEEEGAMKFAIMRDPSLVPEDGRKKLAHILPNYFK